jgi:acetoacetate decarboxylase
MTSPRQDHYGRMIPHEKSEYTTHTIRFKTSRTYLQTLFPSPAFGFVSPATYAEATFQNTTLDKMGWLGGKGYNFFGLWIHGVQYTKKDGKKLFGSYLPVLFESLHDPITTGREELGMPKLWCEIDVYRRPRSSSIKCSWRGATFAECEWEDVVEETATGTNGTEKGSNGEAAAVENLPPWKQTPPDDGLFIYRYVPAVGAPGTADAEYAVFVDKNSRSCPDVKKRTLKARSAKINMNGRDWDSLPTLHHVAAGLAEVPVYEILEAKIVEGEGVEDLNQARRIE